MSQQDWISPPQPAAPIKDIRNQRASTAEAKAVALLRLGELINRIPPDLKAGGSINKVREWTAARKVAAKVAANSRASVSEIQSAINNMQFYWPGQ